MKMRKIICLILSITCFLIAGIVMYKDSKQNKSDYVDKGFYDECIIDENYEQTIVKEDKVSANTNLTIRTLYTICGHEVDEYVPIDVKNVNKTYEGIVNLYPDYDIVEFNNKHVTLKKNEESYCPYHYYLKEEDEKIAIYNEIDKENIKLYEVLDILVSNLRQNDRYIFKNGGMRIYGRENLYRFIEDFDG